MKIVLKEELRKIKNDFKKGNIKKQVANILTASRFLSPFVLIPLMYYDEKLLFFLMVFIFSLTDMFDGYFARKFHAVSLFGKYLDAMVDKVFALSLLIPILIKTTLKTSQIYLVSLCILLEIIIGSINLYSYFKRFHPSSTMVGKLKTIFLFSLLCILYLNKLIFIKDIYLFLALIITVIMQIATVFSYLFQIKKERF